MSERMFQIAHALQMATTPYAVIMSAWVDRIQDRFFNPTNHLTKLSPEELTAWLLEEEDKIKQWAPEDAETADKREDAAIGYNDLGIKLYEAKRFEESEVVLNKALELFQADFGDDHEYVASVLMNQGILNQARQEYTTAESLLNRALEIYTAQSQESGEDASYDVLDALELLADLYRETGREEEAAALEAEFRTEVSSV
ncbi:MAG: tetratricopeptide repeat protein [Vampirovibrio sp.]|nr:tetratricopeptide repeat protein [Vampirovibrio sp.]